MTNVFVYTISDFHDLRQDLLKRVFIKVSKIKNIKDFLKILTHKDEGKKRVFKDRIYSLEKRFVSIIAFLKIEKIYSLGNSYADLICCLLCKRAGIPFVLLSEENIYNKIINVSEKLKTNKSLIRDLFKKASTTISFTENLTIDNYNEISEELINFVQRVCDHIVIISHKDDFPKSVDKFTPQMSDRLTEEIFLIKIP